MSSPLAESVTAVRPRAECFRYAGFEVDERRGSVLCRYELDGRSFQEVASFGPGRAWSEAAREVARIFFLLAGVSYYKAGAPPTVDLGTTPVRPGELAFLRDFYVGGLGEFAFRNGVDLGDLRFVGGVDAPPPAAAEVEAERPLIPFGGGLDSIVTVELVRPRFPDSALFVVNRAGDRFAAIEGPAAETGLPVVRAEREIDPQILCPRAEDRDRFFNGHVPVTGILSAMAVLAATLEGRGAVVMSNEWSASAGNVRVGDGWINHQYSKGESFEAGFRGVLGQAMEPGVEYFSLLRPFSELWIAERFAGLGRYHRLFHSCNRAFALDPAQRLDRWCGTCDKCCFIDLILAPFLAPEDLAGVFDGREPLLDDSLAPRFRALLGTSADRKPFECVGDVAECRTALMLAAARPDRHATPLLAVLAGELGEQGPEALAVADRLLAPMGPHHIPDAYFPAAALG